MYNDTRHMESINILETINKSAFKLLASQSLEKLCVTIVEEAKKLVGAEHGSIYLLEKHKLEKIYTSSHILKKTKVKKKGYTEQTFRTRKITILRGIEMENVDPEVKSLKIKSVVLIPLSYKTESIGVLTLYSLKEEYFTSKQLYILKLFASMACLAIVKTKLHEETKKAVEVRDRFIALASHELRTPLTSLNGYIQLLYTRLAKKGTIESRWVEELYSESNRLTNLVKDLLDVNRIKQGQFVYTLSEVDMKEVIEKVIRHYRSYNADKEIIFEDKVGGKHNKVIGDFDKLRVMISALLSNAVKFSKPYATIIVSLTHTPRSIRIKIKDYGKGIPKHDLERIFEGFYKTKHSRNKEGMGVGLLLAKHVVSYHRGKITISSKEHKGTTVDIELPRIKI